ncbi:hypothetical protein GCM10009801_81690 [Streptomyces albiaxialis]|uniref:Lipoprotein n=1 Tax=Streptomyces albiaxialis TaxID=329523 RepID=A0ABN2X6D9_9ACTN
MKASVIAVSGSSAAIVATSGLGLCGCYRVMPSDSGRNRMEPNGTEWHLVVRGRAGVPFLLPS